MNSFSTVVSLYTLQAVQQQLNSVRTHLNPKSLQGKKLKIHRRTFPPPTFQHNYHLTTIIIASHQ
jgi:hypothetical protein